MVAATARKWFKEFKWVNLTTFGRDIFWGGEACRKCWVVEGHCRRPHNQMDSIWCLSSLRLFCLVLGVGGNEQIWLSRNLFFLFILISPWKPQVKFHWIDSSTHIAHTFPVGYLHSSKILRLNSKIIIHWLLIKYLNF